MEMTEPPPAIVRFVNEYAFLSNFTPITVEYDGVLYRSVEHAYQAAKTVIPEERTWIRNARSPAQAKYAGRRVAIRSNWNSMRIEVMEYLLRQKFALGVSEHHDALYNQLKNTKPRMLIEGNTWGDRFWGCCADKNGAFTDGENQLGKLLMKIRDAS